MFKIFAETISGEVIECFTWRGTVEAGIRRAWSDAERFGVQIVHVWSKAVQS